MLFAPSILLAVNLAMPAAEPEQPSAQLSATLRTILLQQMPTPLYESRKDWDKTKEVKVLRFRDDHFVTKKVAKNDGLWKHIRVDALNPKDNLVLVLRDVTTIDKNKVGFTLFLASDMQIEATQQHWESGIKLYGASIRARARTQITLKCEVTTKTEFKDLLPELVCNVKVIKADVVYDKLVVEHVAGLGGDAAKVIGVAGHELIHQWKPSIERDLLEKANQAVTKAVEKKEIRIGFGKLVK